MTGQHVTPRVVLGPGCTAEDAISRYVDILRGYGPGGAARSSAAGVTSVYQGDLFRIRSGPKRPLEHTVYTLSTQTNYRDLVDRLDAYDLPWGTLVIDAR